MFARLLYAPFLAQVDVTRRCNLTCGYCNEYDDVSSPVPTEMLKFRFRRLKELGTWALELSGGEPLLHPDVEELLRYGKALGFHKTMLITNGFLLNQKRADALNETRFDDLQISIDVVNPTRTTFKVLRTLRPKNEAIMKVARLVSGSWR